MPESETCRPFASTSAQVMPFSSSASRTPISDESSIRLTEKLAATSDTTAAAAKVSEIVSSEERRMGTFDRGQ